MKRFLSAVLAALLLFSLCACGQTAPVEEDVPQITEISLWVYPMRWLEQEAFAGFLAGYEAKNPHTHITVTYLEEDTADATVRGAIETGMVPDLLLGNTKPLVTQFSRDGMMADLTGICDGRGIYDHVLSACTGKDGKVYLAPLFINVYCMAFNQYLFEDADVLEYADVENHCWNSSDFFDAEIEMFDYGTTDFASLYCSGQNGDYGTRAFVTSLYDGGLVDENGSYALTNDKNLRALKKLVRYKGFRWDDTMLAEDAAYLFARGEYAASLCWNVDMMREYSPSFPVIPMAFPTEDGSIAGLPGEIWGLSVFDNRDADRLSAAYSFVNYFYNFDEAYRELLKLSGYFSARTDFTLYADDPVMAPYEALSAYITPEPRGTDNWVQMRTAWCEMLSGIANTDDIGESGIREAMEAFDMAANSQ